MRPPEYGLVAYLDHGLLPASEPVEVEVPGLGGVYLYPAVLAGSLEISGVYSVDFTPVVLVKPAGGGEGLAVYAAGGEECWEGPALIPAPGGLAGIPLGGGLGSMTVRFDQRGARLWARSVPGPGLHGSRPLWASCGAPLERGVLVDVLQYVFEEGIFVASQAHASRGAWMLSGTARSKGVDYAVVAGEADAGLLDCLEAAASQAGAVLQAVPGRGGRYGFAAYMADGGEDDADEIASGLRASCLEGARL